MGLREHLAANNGTVGLKILDPGDIDRAVRLFHRDGFVVVRDALDTDHFVDPDTTPFSSFHDPAGQVSVRDLPCPYVCVNFMPVDMTPLNGPTRQIPGIARADQLTLSEHAQRLTRYVVADSADELDTSYTLTPPH